VNETLNVFERRRSTRAYLDQPLTQPEKDAILHAAFRAPTAGNMMLYTILEVQDQALKDRLAVTCDDQPFIARAPYVLLFLADYQRWFDYYALSGVRERCQELGLVYREPQAGDLLLACCDALFAAQNAVIAAESLGVGSCYIGDILENYEIHRELFGLPRYALPITLVCFGRPTLEHDHDSRVPRFAPEFIAQRDRYHRLSADELERMFAPSEGALPAAPLTPGALNAGQSQYLHKFIAEFSVEMSRSVGEMLKNWG
jgi:nitroreductase